MRAPWHGRVVDRWCKIYRIFRGACGASASMLFALFLEMVDGRVESFDAAMSRSRRRDEHEEETAVLETLF